MNEAIFEPWHHLELVAGDESILSIMNGTFDRSINSIKEIETNILYMMQSSKEWSKAQRQYLGGKMKAQIEININGVMMPAIIEFHWSDSEGILTDVSKIDLVVSGGFQNMCFTKLYESNEDFQKTINDDVEYKYFRGDYEES
jgi:hypothetical protein